MKLVSVNLEMHSYQLENSKQDKDFLSGIEVVCRAILKDSTDVPQAGQAIIVQLSNGRKYKGKIREFRSFPVEKYLAGDLVIVRN